MPSLCVGLVLQSRQVFTNPAATDGSTLGRFARISYQASPTISVCEDRRNKGSGIADYVSRTRQQLTAARGGLQHQSGSVHYESAESSFFLVFPRVVVWAAFLGFDTIMKVEHELYDVLRQFCGGE